MAIYDVIVAGIGVHGSAACWHLARRGLRVLGLDRFDIPNARGSSHGVNRIIRLAYFEHPAYVPLARRAYELWRETERGCGEQLLFVTGGIDAGRANSDVVKGSLLACRMHGLRHEVLDAKALHGRFPGFSWPADFVGVFQPDGGFLACEASVAAQTGLARKEGADVHPNEPMLKWEQTRRGVRVTTERGSYEAGQLVVSSGAWIGDSIPALSHIAKLERQVLAWFEPKDPKLFALDNFPISILQTDEGIPYQFPIWGRPGFKIGIYNHLKETGDLKAVSRAPDVRDEAFLRSFVEKYFPKAAGRTLAMETCIFTNMPDRHFVLDRLPGAENVIVASPCSGHGFKFAPVIGEAVADLVAGKTRLDLALFSASRF